MNIMYSSSLVWKILFPGRTYEHARGDELVNIYILISPANEITVMRISEGDMRKQRGPTYGPVDVRPLVK